MHVGEAAELEERTLTLPNTTPISTTGSNNQAVLLRSNPTFVHSVVVSLAAGASGVFSMLDDPTGDGTSGTVYDIRVQATALPTVAVAFTRMRFAAGLTVTMGGTGRIVVEVE